MAAFCWIGLGKGLRTVFMALVIPSHVPLHRLPAASGLQLLFAGIFYFVMGPVVGEFTLFDPLVLDHDQTRLTALSNLSSNGVIVRYL